MLLKTWWGQEGGMSSDKRKHYSCRGPELGSQDPHQVTYNHLNSLFLWGIQCPLLTATGAFIHAHTCTCTREHIDTHSTRVHYFKTISKTPLIGNEAFL